MTIQEKFVEIAIFGSEKARSKIRRIFYAMKENKKRLEFMIAMGYIKVKK